MEYSGRVAVMFRQPRRLEQRPADSPLALIHVPRSNGRRVLRLTRPGSTGSPRAEVAAPCSYESVCHLVRLGAPQLRGSARMHGLSDAFAIPG